MLITNNRWLLFLVGSIFSLRLQPATATDDLLQSRELRSPPWATGSICTPDGPFYNPNAVAQCKDCCQERKCHNRCLNQCKSNAASTAQNRKDYCRSYDGDKSDGAPAWGTCSDKLGEYKESHCSDYDGCVTKYEARHVANDAWYYCDDLKPPHRDCSAYGDCVYDEWEDIATAKRDVAIGECNGYTSNFCGSCVAGDTMDWPEGNCEMKCDDCTTGGCTDYANCVETIYLDKGENAKDEAESSCKPGNFKDCNDLIPEWHPDCGHWKDDWYDACKAKDCDEILKDLQYAHSKSGSKGRHAVCDDFWECVNDYERYDENSESREKGDDARSDCRQCENSGR